MHSSIFTTVRINTSDQVENTSRVGLYAAKSTFLLPSIDMCSWWSGGLCPGSGHMPPSSQPTTTFRPRRLCGPKWSPAHWCWQCIPLSTGYAYTPWVRSFNLCMIRISGKHTFNGSCFS